MWTDLAWIALLPLLVAAVVMLWSEWWAIPAGAAWALSLGLGYFAGQFAHIGRSAGLRAAIAKVVRPQEALDWLPSVVLVAMGVTLLAAAAPRHWQRWIVGLVALLCVATPVRLLARSVDVTGKWSTGEKLAHLALLAAAMACTWLLLAAPRDDAPPRLRAVLLVVVAAGSAITVALSASFTNGQLCGVVAATLSGTTLVSRRPVGVSGAAGVVTMSLGGLILLSHFYAELSNLNALLLTASLVAAGGPLPTMLVGGPAWRQAVVRAALCLAPLAFAVTSRW